MRRGTTDNGPHSARTFDQQQHHDKHKQRTAQPRVVLNGDGEQCHDAIKRAVRHSSVEIIKKHTRTCPYHRSGRLLPLVAATGRLDVFKHLYKLCGRKPDANLMANALETAVRRDQLLILVWAHAHNVIGWSSRLMDLAAERGYLHIIKWLHKNRSEGCTTAAMDNAAQKGRLEVVKWLHRRRTEGCTTAAMDHAAANGDLKMVQWLDTHRSEGCTVRALHGAIKRRNVLLVKLLYGRRLELSHWPQLKHAGQLLMLLRSEEPEDKAILGYIMECRKQRYLSLQWTEADEEKELRRHGKPHVGAIDGLTLVQFVLKHTFPQSSCEDTGSIVTQYLIRDPRQRFHPIEVANRGLVYWLAHYGGLGSRHLRWLAHRGDLDGARRMHEYMARTPHGCACDGQFKLLTMERGDLAYIQWHVRNCPSMSFEEVVHLAVWTGRTDVIRWIKTNYVTDNGVRGIQGLQEPSLTEMDIAAEKNDLRTVADLRHETAGCTTKAMDLAAGKGHLEVVRWLHRNRHEGCTTDAMDVAASNGHLRVVKWLYRNRKEGYTSLAIDGAAANGHLRVVQWLYHQERDDGSVLSEGNRRILASDNRVMRQYHESLPSFLVNLKSQRHSSLDLAAYHGHFDVVKFLHENHGERIVAVQAMDLAAAAGHLQIVRYLHENRPERCTHAAIYGALRHEHFEVAMYLYEHCPECVHWPKKEELPALVWPMLKLPNSPVIRRLLSFLRLIRKFRLSPRVMDLASYDGDLDLVRMIHELDLGGCTTAAMDFAAMKGNMEMIMFLHSNRHEGCTTDAMDAAAEAGRLDIVTFLHNNRSEGCTRDAIEQAACNGHDQVVKFLHQHRKEGCSSYAMFWATMNNHIDVVRYMVEARMPGDISKCLQAARTLRNESMVEIFTPSSASPHISSSNRTRARRNRWQQVVRATHGDRVREIQVVMQRVTERFVQLRRTEGA